MENSSFEYVTFILKTKLFLSKLFSQKFFFSCHQLICDRNHLLPNKYITTKNPARKPPINKDFNLLTFSRFSGSVLWSTN